MTCVRPLSAWKTRNGGVTFRKSEGYADLPTQVPCGSCVGCRTARAESWTLRLMHEAQTAGRSAFLTLTYSPQELPKDLSLDVSHFQKFCKKLRKRIGSFRFFHCGEYGERSLRPHYHALIFGHDFPDRVLMDHTKGLYTSPVVDECWSRGYATVGSVSYRSAAYVARYCVKKALSPVGAQALSRTNTETGETWLVRPEYVTMSRRPGIGAEWFSRYGSDVFPCDEVVADGRRHRPPRYYDGLFGRADPEALEAVKASRRARVGASPAAFSTASLAAKEAHLIAKHSLRRRDSC